MGKRNRKGSFSAPPPFDHSMRPTTNFSETIQTVSYRGGNVVDDHFVSLGEFQDVKLMWDHRDALFMDFFHNSPKGTNKNAARFLRVIRDYWRHLQTKLRFSLTLQLLREEHTNGFMEYIQTYASKEIHVRYFNRFLRAIGAPARLLIANPYSTSERAVKKSPPSGAFRNAVHRAKADADVIRKRLKDFHRLRPLGRDPRLQRGGWTFPENRIWFVENVIGMSVPAWTDLKRNPEVGRYLYKLQCHVGAPGVDGDGNEIGQNGYLAHVRWFYPQPDDLIPFIALLLLRTPLNLMSIADAQVGGDWESPYYFNMSSKNGEFVFVWFDKVRGRHDRLNDPNPVFAVSPVTPRSYPYQVRKFVEELTAELRKELRREIDAMSIDPAASTQELNRLRSIENDLFLYRSFKGINSLRHVMLAGNPPLFLTEGLRNYGISAGDTRGNNLAHVYNLSGLNLVSIHMLAMHRDKNLSILYARREAAVRKTEQLFRNIFNHSINLIAASIFDTENLKLLLEAQNFANDEIGSLLNADTVARWGNRCANPRRPPHGFADGTPPGQPCRGQNCIDGCPNARWFSDSGKVIKHLLINLRSKHAALPHAATASSSLSSKISRLELIQRELQKGSR